MRNTPPTLRECDTRDLKFSPDKLREEAAYCREQASRFAGRPEETLLVKLASAFEQLGKSDNNHGRQGRS